MRGINFTTPMVRKIGQGCKTQTRRMPSSRPYKVGEILYVKEAWVESPHAIYYWANVDVDDVVLEDVQSGRWRKHPGRYMPQTLARYFIQITTVREQALLDIDEADAMAEGFDGVSSYLAYFRRIFPKAGENPPVVAYSFVRVDEKMVAKVQSLAL